MLYNKWNSSFKYRRCFSTFCSTVKLFDYIVLLSNSKFCLNNCWMEPCKEYFKIILLCCISGIVGVLDNQVWKFYMEWMCSVFVMARLRGKFLNQNVLNNINYSIVFMTLVKSNFSFCLHLGNFELLTSSRILGLHRKFFLFFFLLFWRVQKMNSQEQGKMYLSQKLVSQYARFTLAWEKKYYFTKLDCKMKQMPIIYRIC